MPRSPTTLYQVKQGASMEGILKGILPSFTVDWDMVGEREVGEVRAARLCDANARAEGVDRTVAIMTAKREGDHRNCEMVR